MNNLDYLEYEGSRLLDYAMKTYSKASTDSLVNMISSASSLQDRKNCLWQNRMHYSLSPLSIPCTVSTLLAA